MKVRVVGSSEMPSLQDSSHQFRLAGMSGMAYCQKGALKEWKKISVRAETSAGVARREMKGLLGWGGLVYVVVFTEEESLLDAMTAGLLSPILVEIASERREDSKGQGQDVW